MRSDTSFLHVCDFCGCYWELASGVLRPLTDEQAHQAYDSYFRGQSGRRRRPPEDGPADHVELQSRVEGSADESSSVKKAAG